MVGKTFFDDLYVTGSRTGIFNAIQEYKKSDGTKGIYLYGPFGCGKTFILLNLANYLVTKKNKKVVFAYYPELVREVKSSIANNTLESLIVKLKNVDQLYRDFFNIISIWEQQKMDAVIRTKAFLYSTLALMVENDERNIMNQEINEILSYIFDHYIDHDISVLRLCEKFYISESQLRRNILKNTGLTTNEYITYLRLTRAKRELVCTQKGIKQIAYESGFSSAYYFSRCFHQHENMSPKEYRHINRVL